MITEVQVILFSYNGVDIGISKKLLISSFKFLDAKRADFSAPLTYDDNCIDHHMFLVNINHQ